MSKTAADIVLYHHPLNHQYKLQSIQMLLIQFQQNVVFVKELFRILFLFLFCFLFFFVFRILDLTMEGFRNYNRGYVIQIYIRLCDSVLSSKGLFVLYWVVYRKHYYIKDLKHSLCRFTLFWLILSCSGSYLLQDCLCWYTTLLTVMSCIGHITRDSLEPISLSLFKNGSLVVHSKSFNVQQQRP